jgi:endonuclease/exonuclease/phosphatase family metal-dependent hydrolase
MPIDEEWLLVGDFNMYRRQSDRKRNEGNIQNMLEFNNAINNLRLEELKLFGNKYTWTNKQESPLLERLDWFLTSASWMISYPRSTTKTLSRDISDHSPCLISILTDIPKAKNLDLRITGCFMMTSSKLWNMGGICQITRLTKQKE